MTLLIGREYLEGEYVFSQPFLCFPSRKRGIDRIRLVFVLPVR